MHRIDRAERRARIGVRRMLAPQHRAAGVVEVTRGLVCLHATDSASVYLAAWARLAHALFEPTERALYDDRTLIRMPAMRQTVFVTPVDEAPSLLAATSLGVARRERKRNEEFAARLDVDDLVAFLRDAEAATLAELEARGEATAHELSRAVPALSRKVRVNIGKAYEGNIGLSSRVLLVLAAEGCIVRGRPKGTWVSSQYRWSTMERRIGAPLPKLDVAEAQARLVGRWLERFGPGTEADLRWWTGLTLGAIRAALASVRAEPVVLEEGTGYVMPGDVEPTPPPEPWAALLPALDPTTMGWQGRDWYLGPHRTAIFDSAGNAGPTVWADGRIVGGWAVREGGEVVTLLLEDIGREAREAVDAEAARLSAQLEVDRVCARFPSPLQRHLLG